MEMVTVVRRTALGMGVLAVFAFVLNAYLSARDTAPLRISGGRFEASAVAYVPGTHQVLFVDDDRTREIFLMELLADGTQKRPVTVLPLGADVTDPEGLTFDGKYVYVVGSQSKLTGSEGDGLVRFVFDAERRRIERVERVHGLKAWLAANVAELHGTEQKVGDTVLNVEGLAWDPKGKRLLLGLRAPVVSGYALVVPIRLTKPDGPFTRENLQIDGASIRVALDGAGIRSLEYDDRAKAFTVIAAAALNRETRDFRILEWDGTSGARARQVMTFPSALKPEGIVRATLGSRTATVIVFDTGRFTVVY